MRPEESCRRHDTNNVAPCLERASKELKKAGPVQYGLPAHGDVYMFDLNTGSTGMFLGFSEQNCGPRCNAARGRW